MTFKGWREIINLGTGFFLLVMIFFWNTYLMRHDPIWMQSPVEQIRPMDARTYRILTFGHWPAALDWLTVRFLVEDPSYSHVAQGTHPPAFEILNLATDLDPAFYELYSAGANYLAVVRQDAEGALHLLKKAEKYRVQKSLNAHWGPEWYLLMLMGYVYVYEMGDLVNGSNAFREAGALPAAPQYLRELSQRLARPGGQYEVGLNIIRLMVLAEKNEPTRKKLETKFHSLQVGQYLDYLNRTKDDPSFVLPAKDPWGGRLTRDVSGRILSSTPREKVLGLD